MVKASLVGVTTYSSLPPDNPKTLNQNFDGDVGDDAFTTNVSLPKLGIEPLTVGWNGLYHFAMRFSERSS